MTTPQYPKRPGSPMGYQSMPAAKAPRLNSSQLQINYLVRQRQDTLPLVSEEERMPRILQLIGEYDGVLQRHESMAGNLGACPLGPILLKRFERLFDGPPRVLKSNAKDPNVTWLDIVEFAQNKPEQFNLEKQRNGVRVCQFYHKQCRVEISEEDHVLIASGMPQKLIPPQPILEDEEKELGVVEILERNLSKVFQMADQVSARARQLTYKLKTRRAAILARRETEGDPTRHVPTLSGSPASPMIELGAPRITRSIEQSQSPPAGFTAVNIQHRPSTDADRRAATTLPSISDHGMPAAGINGRAPAHRTDDLSKFLTDSERQAGMTEDSIRRSSLPQLDREAIRQGAQTRTRPEPLSAGVDPASVSDIDSPSVAIPGTPASLLPQVKHNTMPKDDGGPYKTEMVARMESMQRGERIIPPCDRCRRLQMDCMKNLTACQGCTKKHAKCSWKDVTLEELNGIAGPGSHTEQSGTVHDLPSLETTARDWDQMLRDKSKKDPSRPPDPLYRPPNNIEAAPATYVVNSTSPPPAAPAPVPNSTSQPSPKLDVRPPPLEQPLRDPEQARPPSQGRYLPPYNDRDRDHQAQHRRTESRELSGAEDKGDRLQELARKVYRSASQSTRPSSS